MLSPCTTSLKKIRNLKSYTWTHPLVKQFITLFIFLILWGGVGSQRRTTWATAWPKQSLNVITEYVNLIHFHRTVLTNPVSKFSWLMGMSQPRGVKSNHQIQQKLYLKYLHRNSSSVHIICLVCLCFVCIPTLRWQVRIVLRQKSYLKFNMK
jgi:hypothetical protein